MVASSAPELGARRHRRLLPHRQAAAWLCERLHRGRGFFSCWGGTVSGSCTSGVRCGCCYQRKGDLYIGPSLHRHGGPSLVWGLALGRCVAPSLDAHGTWTCPGKGGSLWGRAARPPLRCRLFLALEQTGVPFHGFGVPLTWLGGSLRPRYLPSPSA